MPLTYDLPLTSLTLAQGWWICFDHQKSDYVYTLRLCILWVFILTLDYYALNVEDSIKMLSGKFFWLLYSINTFIIFITLQTQMGRGRKISRGDENATENSMYSNEYSRACWSPVIQWLSLHYLCCVKSLLTWAPWKHLPSMLTACYI